MTATRKHPAESAPAGAVPALPCSFSPSRPGRRPCRQSPAPPSSPPASLDKPATAPALPPSPDRPQSPRSSRHNRLSSHSAPSSPAAAAHHHHLLPPNTPPHSPTLPRDEVRLHPSCLAYRHWYGASNRDHVPPSSRGCPAP